MLAPHLELGRDAEVAALEYFLKHTPGARLLERNCRFRVGEIDLVFEVGQELVFVEVRARSHGALARGFETLGPVKRARLRRAIQLFLASYRVKYPRHKDKRSLRIDILSWDSGEWTHLKNVWI